MSNDLTKYDIKQKILITVKIWDETVDAGEFTGANGMSWFDSETEIELRKINLMYCREHFDKILDCPS